MPTKQKATKSTGLVRPIEPASRVGRNGEMFVINPHEVYSDTDPLVRKYPHLFQPLEPTHSGPVVAQLAAPPVETPTETPAEPPSE